MAENVIVTKIQVDSTGSKTVKELKAEINSLTNSLTTLDKESEEYSQTLNKITEDSKLLAQAQNDAKKAIQAANDEISGKSVSTMKEMRKEIMSLRSQLLSLDEGSEEYNKTLQQLADAQFKVRDANEIARLSANDLGEKLNTIGLAASGIVSGFSAAQGVVALFGAESENLEKTMIKLQAGIAIVQGIQGLEGLNQIFAALKIQFAGALTSLKGFIGGLSLMKKALLATGLGALVVVIGEVIANWDKISKLWKDTSPQDAATAAVERLKNSLDGLDYYLTQQNLIALKEYNEALKEAGNDIKKIDEATKQYNETIRQNELDILSTKLETARYEASKLLSILSDMSKSDEGYDEIKKQLEETNQSVIKLSTSYQTLINKGYLEAANAAKELIKQNSDATQSLSDSAKEITSIQERINQSLTDEITLRTQQFEREKSLFEQNGADITKLQEEFNKDIQDLKDKAAEESLNKLKENSDLMVSELSNKISLLEEQRTNRYFGEEPTEQDWIQNPETAYAKQKEINDAKFQADYELYQQKATLQLEALNSDQLTEEQRLQLTNEYFETEFNNSNLLLQQYKKNEDLKVKYAKSSAAQSKLIQQSTLTVTRDVLSSTASLFGEQSAAGKAMAVAAATIDTYKAANSAYAAMAGIPVVGPALGIAAAAAAVISGIANVKNILSVDPEGSSSSAASVSTAVPQTQTFTSLPTEMLGTVVASETEYDINASNAQNPVKVYVTEEDITNTQNTVRTSVTESSF